MRGISSPPNTQPVIAPKPGRAVYAFLFAPLAGPLGIYLGMVLLTPQTAHLFTLIAAVPFFYLLATPFVYLFSLLLGIPLFLLLSRLRGVNRSSLIGGWAAIGVVSLAIFTGFHMPRGEDAPLYLPFALGGSAVGWVFWRILSTGSGAPFVQDCDTRCLPGENDKSNITRENWR